MKVLTNHIGGEAVPPSTNAWLDDHDPATGQVAARVPRSGEADVNAAVAAARASLAGPWGGWSTAERADLMDEVADRIEQRLEDFAHAETEDTGKPLHTSKTLDIPRSVANFRFFAGAVRHSETAFHEMANGAFNYTLRRPLGVVALITPWNLPLYLLSWKVAPAMATGNAVVAKPSELTPQTASMLAEVLAEVGAPAGSFNLVHGNGPEVGGPLVSHRDVAGVSFTGGTATGALVAAAAAPKFKKLSLELGGKNPTLVFADADREAALNGAVRAGFTNTGQICLCGSRLLVERSIHDDFVDELVARVEALPQGDPMDEATRVGALVSEAHRDKVEGYVRLAREEGGTIRCGGVRPRLGGRLEGGWFLRPTVVTGLAPACRTATEEIFGPVVTVHPFDTEEEALAIANGVRYGLSASLWTQNLARAHRVAAALEVGMVWVNTWLMRDLRVPFGGLKDSGVGREGGKYSLSFYTDDKNVCIS
ncbi:MAG: aldehyde dehydrogenase [Alphaproteobacteria bacterium]|nr:aldehyde dehydrogenase [Alphaproteobacteria bacterium]